MKELIGKTIKKITINDDRDEILFVCSDGDIFKMYDPDGCANVYIDDISGDIEDLIDTTILKASEDTNHDNPKDPECYDSFTWTFYNFQTNEGTRSD